MLKCNKGLSVIELMVGVGVLAISAVIVFMPQIEIQKRMMTTEKKASRIVQINDLKQKILSTENSLSKSALVAPDNAPLCPCTQGGNNYSGTSKICAQNQCQANQEIDFSFFDPKSTTPLKLSGTTASPVYYTNAGTPCPNSLVPVDSDPEKICGYKATTKFKAHCPGDLATCDHADYLIVTLELFPVGANSSVAYEKTQMLYTVPLNYRPTITTIADQTLTLSEQKKIAVNANAGDPTENQKFIFEECESETPSIVDIKCYKFVNGVAQIILTGKASGTSKITLKINDGGSENNLSDPLTFIATVAP